MMLASTPAEREEAAWAFMDWWSRAETQSQFGSEMECILGTSARYNTANEEAFTRLPWSASEIETLQNQLAVSYGVPEAPGGYFIQRHINNAFRKIIYRSTNIDPKDTLLDYAQTINEEITKKREEFGLEVVSDSE